MGPGQELHRGGRDPGGGNPQRCEQAAARERPQARHRAAPRRAGRHDLRAERRRQGLCQGVGLAGRYQTHEDEGLFVIGADGAEKKLTITDCTQGTIDFTVPDDIEAGEYRIEVRSRAGEGLNRTLVRASINGFTIKAA